MHISDVEPTSINPSFNQGQSGPGGQINVLIGLAILGLVTFTFLALASWSVLDPSWSHSNAREVANYMGYPGAVTADFIMQFLGLGAAIALIPPAIWGWWKLVQRPISGFRRRVIAWPFAMVAIAAGISSISIPESWPLPLGLGGVVGDRVLSLPFVLFGFETAGFMNVVVGAAFLVIGGFLTLFASGLVWSAGPEAEYDVASQAELLEEEERAPSWILGAMVHLYYSAKVRWFPKSSQRTDIAEEPKMGLFARAKAAVHNLTTPRDDGLDDFEFNSAPETPVMAHPEPEFETPVYGEQVYNEYEQAQSVEDQWAEQSSPAPAASMVQPQAAEVVTTRVQPMAEKPKPSARVTREAQPSLINMADFELPSLHFLQEVPPGTGDSELSTEALEQNARLLEGVLDDFGVKGEIINVRPGPVVTLYELEPAPGIKSSRVIGLADDIARSMSAIAARVAVVPGRNAIGIELPNHKRETVYLREILASQTYEKSKAKLPLILGKTIGGESTIADLAKMPHLLVAGTTGSGKSVAINTMILSILYRMSPEQVKMIMIDPKMLELSIYDGIPHLLTPVVTDPKKAVVALKWTVREMEERYKKMSKLGVRNIDGYNSKLSEAKRKNESLTRTVQTGFDKETGEPVYETEQLEFETMPYIVVIIDEMADLMMVAGKDIEGAIQRLAQMARAAGIHVIMATQRPSVDVITGTIKANFPTRISFQVTSKIDSRTILGEQGAEQLLGMGDMLYMAGGGRIQRVHGPFVDDGEVDMVVKHLKTQGVPQYLEAVTEEPEEEAAAAGGGDAGGLAQSNDIYDQAVAVVLQDRKVSTSYIQRRLGIGYNRAATLIERMEEEGLISSANHAGKREILVPGEDETI